MLTPGKAAKGITNGNGSVIVKIKELSIHDLYPACGDGRREQKEKQHKIRN